MELQKVAKRLAGMMRLGSDEFTTELEREIDNRENPYVFECSGEVVNKVGGIYTVLRTKAAVTTEELGDQYYMLGPYNEDTVRLEVELSEPQNPAVVHSLNQLKEEGFKVHHGRWLIDGNPKVILFDVSSGGWKLDQWKRELWNASGVGIPFHDRESNDAVVLGFLVAQFLQKFQQYFEEETPPLIVAHFHEWIAGVGLLMLRCWNVDISTIFTTHATLLGRYLAAGGSDLYNILDNFDLDQEAGKKGIYHRYILERAAAHTAHIFTTVSEITGFESEHLLKRKPEIITPNGLNVVKFEALHEFQNLHVLAKEKIHDFIRGHFCGHYNFDLDKTLFFFTSGRYEFINKGGDLFIEALARLNHRLKVSSDLSCRDVTVVAFLIYQASNKGNNAESLEGQVVAKKMRETVEKIKEKVGRRMVESCFRGQLPNSEDMMLPAERVQLKRCILSMHRKSLPPICTHNMTDDTNDPVLKDLRKTQLFNKSEDRVKVIFHPEFLSSANGLIGLDYEEFVRGCHLGVFPSYYEPWGYTPAECTVMGIPSISTNLSGFGGFIEENVQDPAAYGIYVVDRRHKCAEDSVKQLTQKMFDFCNLSRRQRIITRNRTERLSELLDWKSLGPHYREARRMALMKTHPELVEKMAKGYPKCRLPRPASLPVTPGQSDDEGDEGENFPRSAWHG